MLSSSVSSATPFSVRDILNENQQLGVMDCYGSHQQSPQGWHVPTDYYAYNVIPDNNWDVEKYKEQTMTGYQNYSELSHSHQMSQVVPSYEENPVVEEGMLYSISCPRYYSINSTYQ